MNLNDFALAIKMRQDRMVLLWSSSMTTYDTNQAREITSNLLRAADTMIDQLREYRDSWASIGQAAAISLMLSELADARRDVSYAASVANSASTTTVSLPNLKGAAVSLLREVWSAADGLNYLQDLSSGWLTRFLAVYATVVLSAVDATIGALGWIGKLTNLVASSWTWVLWGSAGFAVYWFFLRKPNAQ